MALDEFSFIEQIRRRAATGPGVAIGIGDDCAALEIPPGEQLLTTCDLLLDGVHFRREWTSLYDLGAKAAAVNLSDLASMGAHPAGLLLALGLPEDLDDGERGELVAGFMAEADRHDTPLVGGDTCRAQQFLTLSVTAFGTAPPGQTVRRAGACVGHKVFVSGCLGDSALALRLLQAGGAPDPYLAGRHHRPTPRIALGRGLATVGVSAMIDISDGLLADLGHILEASGVGAEIQLERLPLSAAFQGQMTEIGEPLELALAGGEDYELLFTASPDREAEIQDVAASCGVPVTSIGTILAGAGGLWLVDARGKRSRPRKLGFDHFND